MFFESSPHDLNEQSGLHDAFSGLMLVDSIPALQEVGLQGGCPEAGGPEPIYLLLETLPLPPGDQVSLLEHKPTRYPCPTDVPTRHAVACSLSPQPPPSLATMWPGGPHSWPPVFDVTFVGDLHL